MTPRSPKPDDDFKSWALMPSSAKGACKMEGCKKKKNLTMTLFPSTVDKLQFEPPLRKETEAHSEMVMRTFS